MTEREKSYILEALRKDYATLHFDDETGFSEFLALFEQETLWRKIKHFDFASLFSSKGPELFHLYRQSALPLQEGQMYIIYNEGYVPLRDCAFATAAQRYQISGRVLNKICIDDFVAILNKVKKVCKSSSLLYQVGGKVSALRSSRYVPLRQQDIYVASSNYFNSHFVCDFVGADWEPSLTSATWYVNDEDVMKSYRELFQHYQYKNDCLMGIVTISTSDTGNHSVYLRYKLIIDSYNTELPLGSVKLQHKGKATMEVFKENLEKTFTFYQEQMVGVSHLFEITVKYPINCLFGFLKLIGISKEKANEFVEANQNRFGKNASGYEIYACICEFAAKERNAGLSETNLIQLEEKIARIPKEKWGKYDLYQFSW